MISNIKIKQKDLEEMLTPIQTYFMGQDCRETLHSCQNDACHELEPQCFKKKLYGQIGVVYEYIREQINSMQKPGNGESPDEKNESKDESENGTGKN